jgi:hypothetical protein
LLRLTPVRSASRRKRWCFASGMRIVIVAIVFSPSLHEFCRRFDCQLGKVQFASLYDSTSAIRCANGFSGKAGVFWAAYSSLPHEWGGEENRLMGKSGLRLGLRLRWKHYFCLTSRARESGPNRVLNTEWLRESVALPA